MFPARGDGARLPAMADDIETLRELEKKILWLASWTIHNANHLRENGDGLKVGGHQASSASLATIMTALYLDVLQARRPRRGEAARLADLPRHSIFARQADARAAGGVPRLQRRAELSVAHQGRRRRRFLHRLGRPRRGADAVLLAGAGLRARAWLGHRPAGRPHGGAGRRRRTRRRQYLRSAARRLETGPAQLLVDHRLQPAEPRRGGARGPVGALRTAVQEFRLGRGDPEIRLAAAGRVQGAGRRKIAAMDRPLPQPALFGAGVRRRRRLAQAAQ